MNPKNGQRFMASVQLIITTTTTTFV